MRRRTAGQALRHRLLLEDHGLFRERLARLQLGARAHALDRERGQRRQSRAHLHRRVRRRRFPVHRPGTAGARHPAQCEHALFDREQRRLRADQGPVLRLRGHRHEAKKGEINQSRPSIRCCWRSALGATFVARSFSGDKAQLVPLIQAGMRHRALRSSTCFRPA